jgi:trigger factor
MALKLTTQPLEDHQVKLTVEVESSQFEDAKQRAARKLARQIKIPGFRPGKAPYPVILRHLGEAAIAEEAIEILVDEIYPQAIKEAEINPYGPGSLEGIPQLDPPVFEFSVPLKASVELGDYHSIRLPYEKPEISEERIDEVVASLQDRQAIIEPVERPAQEGDLVRLELEGMRRSPVEGEDATLIAKRSRSVLIEPPKPSAPSEWPFPGFARQLIGRSAGEQITLEHTFSDDAEYESLRGADAEFHVSIEQVNARELPALDDEFAKSAGEFETLDAMRLAIREDLVAGETNEYNEDYDDKVLEEIVKISTIKFPPQMLDREIENVIERLESNLAQQKLYLDLYLKARQMDMDGLKEEARPVAEARLKKTLVLLEVADQEKITINPDDLQSETTRALNELAYMMEEKEFNKLVRTEANRTNLVGNVMMDMMMTRTYERLRLIATGQEPAADAAGDESAADDQPPASAPADEAVETPPAPEVEETTEA